MCVATAPSGNMTRNAPAIKQAWAAFTVPLKIDSGRTEIVSDVVPELLTSSLLCLLSTACACCCGGLALASSSAGGGIPILTAPCQL